jgi:hypothetical protein
LFPIYILLTFTTRRLHTLDLITQLLYLGILAHYVLYPPSRPIHADEDSDVDARGIILLIYAIANVVGMSNYLLPSVLVALAFLVSLPASPVPGDGAFGTVLTGFLLHIVLLHIPRAPTPSFFAPEAILPLATLLFYEFQQTLYPAILFFSPALLVGLYLLSLSLLEDNPIISPPPHVPVPTATANVQASVVRVIAAPMESREAILALLVTILVLLVFSACLLVLFSASLRISSTKSTSKWDRYTLAVGNKARRLFILAIVRYSSPHFFPAPFNLPPLIFVYLPMGLLRLYSKRELRFARWVETVFWWGTVGACALALAGLGWFLTSVPLMLLGKK